MIDIALFILSCGCLCLAGIANGAMDTLVHHYEKSVFSNRNKLFWNPSISWINKYVANPKLEGDLIERFWGSSRWFVFLTDGWHLCKAVFLFFIGLAIVLFRLPDWSLVGLHIPVWLNYIVSYLLLRGAMGLGFVSSYNGFWLKKQVTT